MRRPATWFERLMGFPEESPEQVRANIELRGEYLVSRVNGRRVRCGRLAMPSLAELRRAVGETEAGPPARVVELVGDVAVLHRDPRNAGAMFQAASQFNLLEMAGPSVTPERGVGIYEHDRTQGPACATSCGGGTIYRNYFVPVGDQVGQSATRQLDCLAELAAAFGPDPPWETRNGYALASAEGLARVAATLAGATPGRRDELRGLLRIGIQDEVEVLGTDHVVTQVYGAAMPVSYGRPPRHAWEPIARLVLEASYEATLLAARRRGIARVHLTLLGGGVFGNDRAWIADSLLRSLRFGWGLDVRIVSYGRPSPVVARILAAFAAGRSRVG